jgi:hypothetical protein
MVLPIDFLPVGNPLGESKREYVFVGGFLRQIHGYWGVDLSMTCHARNAVLKASQEISQL